MIVTVHVQGNNPGDSCLIGYVSPPHVNDKPIYHDDDVTPQGRRAKNGEILNVHHALEEAWTEWHEATPHPETDSEFIDWLVEKKGWTIPSVNLVAHTFN